MEGGVVKGTVHDSGSQLAQSKDPHFFLYEVVTQNVLNPPFFFKNKQIKETAHEAMTTS